jgi:hypothetical protein
MPYRLRQVREIITITGNLTTPPTLLPLIALVPRQKKK